MADKLKIGWIGLGKMGAPMSKNLIKAGYSLIVYDLSRERMDELAAQSARVADSPRDLASGSDVIISMITDDPALEDVTVGPEGAFRGAGPGSIYIDMSTVSAVMSERISRAAEDRGIQYLRAPVSGSTIYAEEAKLTVLVSGPRESYDKCLEIFRVMSQKAFHVGAGEEARYLKLLINMMVGITAAMTAEALTFGKRGGMDWEQMIDIINSSVVGSPLIDFKVQQLKERDFTPAFTTAQMGKDFDLALDTGMAVNTPMPLTSMVRQFISAMKARGTGDLDYFGLVTLWESMADL